MFNRRVMAIGQGVFYIASGLWPVLHMKSFEKVTGPKTDDWLVKTVGLLIAVTGATLLRSGIRDEVSDEGALAAAGDAAVLGGVSGWYGSCGRISRIYLLDSVVELALVAGWVAAELSGRRRAPSDAARSLRAA